MTERVSSPPRIGIVIPAYNESTVIAGVVDELAALYPTDAIIVVDDGSRDETSSVLRDHAAYVLRHAVNLGQGAALQTGIDYAVKLGCKYIATFDADGQHDATQISMAVEELEKGDFDIVLGSRFLEKESTAQLTSSRKRLLRLATIFTRMTTGLALTDTHNGFRVFRASAAPRLRMHINGMAHASEILENVARNSLRWKEVPVIIRYTEYSMQKGQRASNLVNILWDLFLKR